MNLSLIFMNIWIYTDEFNILIVHFVDFLNIFISGSSTFFTNIVNEDLSWIEN